MNTIENKVSQATQAEASLVIEMSADEIELISGAEPKYVSGEYWCAGSCSGESTGAYSDMVY